MVAFTCRLLGAFLTVDGNLGWKLGCMSDRTEAVISGSDSHSRETNARAFMADLAFLFYSPHYAVSSANVPGELFV